MYITIYIVHALHEIAPVSLVEVSTSLGWYLHLGPCISLQGYSSHREKFAVSGCCLPNEGEQAFTGYLHVFYTPGG